MPDPSLWDRWAVARSYETVESWDDNYRSLDRVELTKAELRRHHGVDQTHPGGGSLIPHAAGPGPGGYWRGGALYPLAGGSRFLIPS